MMTAVNVLAVPALSLSLRGLYASLQYYIPLQSSSTGFRLHHLPKSGSEVPYRSPHINSMY